MKFILALIISFSASVAAAPLLPGQWSKLEYKPSAIVQEVYLEETRVMKSISSNGVEIRTGVTYHHYDPTYKWSKTNLKPTHGIRITMHNCKANILGVIATIMYQGDKAINVQIVPVSEVKIVRADIDPLYVAEHTAICNVPSEKLFIDPSTGTTV